MPPSSPTDHAERSEEYNNALSRAGFKIPFHEKRGAIKAVRAAQLHNVARRAGLMTLLSLRCRKFRDDDGALVPVTNDPKLGLRFQPGGDEATVYRTGYYDSIFSNEAARWVVMEKPNDEREESPETDTIVYKFGEVYPFGKLPGKVLTLARPDGVTVANHIGVSTLGLVCNDDGSLAPMLFKQSKYSFQSAGYIVVTGSGSADYADLRPHGRKGNLIDVVRAAMARELDEEVQITNCPGISAKTRRSTYASNTRVIGFFRWVERGGKPEFVGISKLKCEPNSVQPRGKELVSSEKDGPLGFITRFDDFAKIPERLETYKRNCGGKLVIALSNLYLLLRLAEIAQRRNEDGFRQVAMELEEWLFGDLEQAEGDRPAQPAHATMLAEAV